jgi:uncharacterized membrane protein YccF (DUF307 family)
VRVVLNIIWLVLAGVWLTLGYVFAAVLMAITIIGIPFAVQAIKLAGYALWPFGRVLVPAATRHKGLSAVANVLWFILAGWWLALAHLLAGILLCLTIIGIPLGVASFKMAGAALVPFGKEVVRLSDLARPPAEGAIVVGPDDEASRPATSYTASRAERPREASRADS